VTPPHRSFARRQPVPGVSVCRACAGKALVQRGVAMPARTQVVGVDAQLGDGATEEGEIMRWCVVPSAELAGLVDAALRGPWAQELAMWLARPS
jgi:hypothetical protein